MNRGYYIKSLIKDKGYKISEIAEKMEICKSTLSNKIIGKRIFKEKEIDILTNMLDMTYEEIFKPDLINIVGLNQKLISIGKTKFVVPESIALQLCKYIRYCKSNQNIDINIIGDNNE